MNCLNQVSDRNGVFARVFRPLFPIAGYKYGIRMHNAYDPRLDMGSDQKNIYGYKEKKDMRDFRMDRNTTEHYTSFQEAAAAWGCKPFTKKTKDEKKLAKQQEDFCAKYKCSACGQPMKYVGGRWMACANEKCKGIKVEREDSEGNKIVNYRTSCEYIKKDNDAEYASGIFS